MRALLALVLCPAMLAAQDTATLAGSVRAQSGAPVPGARITFDPGALVAETDAQGRFRLRVPAAAVGIVTFAAVGFSPEALPVATLPAGAVREFAITLAPLYTLDALTVIAQPERPLLNTEDAATGGAVERAELEALPTDQRDPLSLLFNVPGVAQATGFFGDAPALSINGSNSLYTQYTLDGLDNNEGFLGGPRVEFPLGGLAREEALVNTYSTEYGRSSNGVINLISRAGGNEARGEIFGYWRPGRPFDARNKIPAGGDAEVIEQQQDGFRRFQLGGGISGPIARDRTFAAVAVEYTNENEDRIGSTALTAFVGTELREKVKLFGRVDHGWSPSQTTTLRAAFSHVNRAGNGSGVVTPEADITTRRIGSLTALTHRSALSGGRASNSASIQLGTFRWYFPPTESDFTRPQVTVVSPDGMTTEAVVGSSNFVFDEKEIQFQLRDIFETRLGDRHTLRVGADLITAWFELAGAQTNPNGAYVVYNDGNITRSREFLSIDDIPADVRVRSYTIDANPQQVDLTQTLVGGFIEDRWRISPSLVVRAGLRWDYDDITSRGESDPDLNNLQPRVSFNWLRTPRSVMRGGVGLYTGKFPYTIYSDAVQFGPNGNATVTFAEGTAFPPPAYGQGPTAADLAALQGQLPPREQRRAFALGLEQPRTWQATLGWQQQVGDAWAISVDAVWADTRNLPRSLDLNAIARPLGAADSVDQTTAFGDPFRPDPPAAGSYRRLTTTEAGGRARYYGLYTTVRRRLSDAWTVDANWVWSKAQNDTEDINFNAYQANCFSEDMVDAVTGETCTSHEWADAINDRRHKVTLRSVYTWAGRVRLSVIGDFQTGQPVNRVAFFRDLDGSGSIFGNGFIGNNDRFLGVDRNAERLPSFFNLSAGVAYLLDTRFGDLEFRADMFNALNETEWGNFANGLPGGGSRTQVGRLGDPIVLRSPGPPRQVQFSARYVF
ncbi:MAG: TonB-dependent receptor [Gemmatimonadales bacterium]